MERSFQLQTEHFLIAVGQKGLIAINRRTRNNAFVRFKPAAQQLPSPVCEVGIFYLHEPKIFQRFICYVHVTLNEN